MCQQVGEVTVLEWRDGLRTAQLGGSPGLEVVGDIAGFPPRAVCLTWNCRADGCPGNRAYRTAPVMNTATN